MDFVVVFFGVMLVGFMPMGFVPMGFMPMGFMPMGFMPMGFMPMGFMPMGFMPMGFMPMGYHPSLICNAPLGLPAKLTQSWSNYAEIPLCGWVADHDHEVAALAKSRESRLKVFGNQLFGFSMLQKASTFWR